MKKAGLIIIIGILLAGVGCSSMKATDVKSSGKPFFSATEARTLNLLKMKKFIEN